MPTALSLLWLVGTALWTGPPAPQAPQAPRSAWLRPDTVLHPPGAVPLLIKSSPAEGLTAIRVFFPLDESFTEAGMGRILARVAAERVAGGAARVGATFEAIRTPDGISYTVTGADEDFDYLSWILRQAVSEPTESDVVVRRWSSRARLSLEQARETGRGWVQADLLGRICPEVPPEVGLSAPLAGASREGVRRFWRRTHTRDRASVIVVTRAPWPLVLSALRTLDLPEEAGPGPAGTTDAVVPPARSPEVLRRWYGEARPLPGDAPAETRVLGELLRTYATDSGRDYEIFLEVRRARCSAALLAMGTAYRSGDRDMRSRISGLPEWLANEATEGNVRAAAADARRTLARGAADPSGLAAALGREGADAGDPDGLSRLYDRLGLLGQTEMAAFLGRISALTPLRSEVRP